MAMKVRLKKPMPATNFSDDKFWRQIVLEPGIYRVARVPNPSGMGVNWQVVEGTKIGAAEVVWEEYLRNGKEKES